MGKLTRRGKVYYADLRSEGAGRVSLRTEDRAVAKDRLRRLELAATNPAAHGLETLGDALLYLLETAMAAEPEGTIHSYTFRARHLLRLLGRETLLRQLSRDDLQRYVAHRLRVDEASSHTIHKEMVVLRRALKEAKRRGLWAGDARELVPQVDAKYEPRERWLTEDEYRALLEALPECRRLWLVTAVYTGACLGELERLSWDHIDLATGWVRIPGTKRESRWRRVPLAEPLRRWLEAIDAAHRRGPLLARWDNYRRDLRAACARVNRAERKRLVREGVEPADAERLAPPLHPVSANDLRRTFASWLLQAGVDPLTVSRLLGHSSTRMVERVYGQLSPAVYQSAIARLGDCDTGVPDKVPTMALGGEHGNEDSGVGSEKLVPRDRVELPTRGFSVRVLMGGKGKK